MLIYIDGSGDFGLTKMHIGKSSSTYYCLGIVVTELSYMELVEKVNHTRRHYEEEFNQKLPSELKYTKMSKSARKYFCMFLDKSPFAMYLLILNKHDKNGTVAHWNKAGISEPILIREMLLHLIEILFLNQDSKLNTREKVGIYFDDNLHTEHAKMLNRQIRKISDRIKIYKGQNSKNNVGIQLADILAGSCFHYLNAEKSPFELIIGKCRLSEISLHEEMGFYKLMYSKFIQK